VAGHLRHAVQCDNLSRIEWLQRHLGASYRVHTLEFSNLLTFEPDIALLDIDLPVMDGYELAQRLLAQRRIHLVAVRAIGAMFATALRG
jgi:CheY-like chemotaxis protein